jgi:hypothetical protein
VNDPVTALKQYLGNTTGPWIVAFFATESNKTVQEAHFGYMHFLVESFSIGDGTVNCSAHDGYNVAQFLTAALYEPRIYEGHFLLSYLNAITNMPGKSREEQMIWVIGIRPANEQA